MLCVWSSCCMCVDRSYLLLCCFFFFFQAEDGIRDVAVTGVQTCALPISRPLRPRRWPPTQRRGSTPTAAARLEGSPLPLRSEERRVGKECRSRWSPYH